MRRQINCINAVASLLVLVLAASCSKKEKMTLETATVTRGEITQTVTATGTLESVTPGGCRYSSDRNSGKFVCRF